MTRAVLKTRRRDIRVHASCAHDLKDPDRARNTNRRDRHPKRKASASQRMTLVELGDDVLSAKSGGIVFGMDPEVLQKFIKRFIPKIGDRRRTEAAFLEDLMRIHFEMKIVNEPQVLQLLADKFARAPVHIDSIMP